jgi:hypothetical protein
MKNLDMKKLLHVFKNYSLLLLHKIFLCVYFKLTILKFYFLFINYKTSSL